MYPMALTKSQKLIYALINKLGVADDKVKLAKLAYFSDFIHYAFNNKPISENTTLYQKRDYGPLSISFNADLKYLFDEGLIDSPKKYHFKVKKNVDLGLDAKEQKTIDYVFSKYSYLSYDVLADISHKQIPYMSADDGGIIDYNTAYNLVEEYPDYAK
ncbi:MAG: Panacea domain-containing protein [bacterium]|nr:Panacea domain-containing protein [bacterium]